MSSVSRPKLANLAVLAVGLAVGLLLCEGLLRALGHGADRFEAFAGIPFKYRAQARVFNRKENLNKVVMNNWGFHDHRRAPEAPGYRILVLGDSFVEGLQVDVEDLFTSRLEGLLRRDDPKTEVLNAGLGGIGTAHEYLLWRDFFRDRIRLDQVLLFLCNGNDLPNNHPLLESAVNGNETENKAYLSSTGEVYVITRTPRWKRRLLDRITSVSVLASTLRRSLYLLRKSLRSRRSETSASIEEPDREEQLPAAVDLDEAWREAIAGTLGLIDRWQADLRRSDIDFSVVVMPWADHLPENPYGYPQKAVFVERLRELAAERRFGLLELRYGDRGPVEIFSFDGVTLGHFNPQGHALVAKRIGDWIRLGRTDPD